MPPLKKIPLLVRHADGESADSLLGRLALRNGCVSARQMGSLFRITRQDLSKERQIRSLAALSGLPAQVLVDWSPVAIGDSEIRLRGETLRANYDISAQGSGRTIRACPQCLRDDLVNREGPPASRPYLRSWWRMRDIYTCPNHLCILIEAKPGRPSFAANSAPDGPTRTYWNSFLSSELVPVAKEHVEADSYILGRLGALPATVVPWLDALPLGQASAAMTWIGEFAVSGTLANYVRRLPFAEAARLRSEGFRACQNWPMGLYDLLHKAQRATPQTARGLKGRFGRFYSRLYDDRAGKSDQEVRENMRATVSSFIKAHVPLDDGETVFRKAMPDSARVTVGSAARASKISSAAMIIHARENGLFEDGDEDGSIFGLPRVGMEARVNSRA